MLSESAPGPVRLDRFDAEVRDRFWSKVAIGSTNECWPWTAGGVSYGKFRGPNRRMYQASRLAWALANNQDPAGRVVRHTCDNPPCCNPAHLLIGTHQDNMDDKTVRGRCRTGRQDGEHNGAALLSNDDVGQIVQCFRDGLNNQDIAARFPVGHSLVSRIRTGRSWRQQSAAFGWEPMRLVAPPTRHLDKGEG